ncbi:MAG: hypothetical protein IAG10_16045 [Planctomycetaceae bacterium]|nr:hypothetical protein [Planctomycetaceae bacterium]
MFGQVFAPQDLVVVLILVVLEGVLSIDNALVLGMLARRLPKHQQSRALTWGLVGAFVFRLAAIAFVGTLLTWHWAKLLGGLYLLYVALKYFLFEARESQPHESIVENADGMPGLVDADTRQPLSAAGEEAEIEARSILPIPDADESSAEDSTGKKYPNFWLTIGSIELTDIAFAVDSIFAAMAFIPPMPAGQTKLWVVFTGGFMGVILMRYAAVVFIKLLEKFPRFEVAAYLLVSVIAGKLLAEYFFEKLNFHHITPEFFVFWILMILSFAIGFLPKKSQAVTK